MEGKFELNEWTPPALCDEHTAKQAKSGKENVKKTTKKRKQVERMSQSQERQKVFMHILDYIRVAICVNYHYPLLLFSHSMLN